MARSGSFVLESMARNRKLHPLVSTYVLSTNPSFIDTVKAALTAENIHVYSAAPDVVSAVLMGTRSKWELVIVDVDSVRDGGRLIDFIKSSAPVRAIRVLAIGSASELAKLGDVPGGSADETLESTRFGTQILEVVSKLRADLGPPGGVRGPQGQGAVDLPPRNSS
jgi:hypothetical protein